MDAQKKKPTKKALRAAIFRELSGILDEELRRGKLPIDVIRRLTDPRRRETVRRMLRPAANAWKADHLPAYTVTMDYRKDIHRLIEEHGFVQVDDRIVKAILEGTVRKKPAEKRLYLVPPFRNGITAQEQKFEMAALGFVEEGIRELLAFRMLSGITATNFVVALDTTLYHHRGSSRCPVHERTSRGCQLVATCVDPGRRFRVHEATFLMSGPPSNGVTVS